MSGNDKAAEFVAGVMGRRSDWMDERNRLAETVVEWMTPLIQADFEHQMGDRQISLRGSHREVSDNLDMFMERVRNRFNDVVQDAVIERQKRGHQL